MRRIRHRVLLRLHRGRIPGPLLRPHGRIQRALHLRARGDHHERQQGGRRGQDRLGHALEREVCRADPAVQQLPGRLRHSPVSAGLQREFHGSRGMGSLSGEAAGAETAGPELRDGRDLQQDGIRRGGHRRLLCRGLFYDAGGQRRPGVLLPGEDESVRGLHVRAGGQRKSRDRGAVHQLHVNA